MCMARNGMLSERVGSMHARKHYVCTSLVQNGVCTCCALCRSMKKCLCKVTGEKTDVRESQGWRHRQGSASMKRFAGLSLVPASQFVAQVSQLFAFPLSAFLVLLLSPLRTALSPPRAHTSASCGNAYMVCQRGHMQRICITVRVNGTDTVGRSVGQCTRSCRPR